MKNIKIMESKVIPAKVWQLIQDYYPSVAELIEDFCDTYKGDDLPL